MDSKMALMRKMMFERWKIYATTKVHRQREIRKAAYFYNVRLKQKALNSLRSNYAEAKRVQSFYAKISIVASECSEFQTAMSRKFILKRSFHTWALYSRYRCRKKSLKIRITELRDELVVGKYIKNWKFICLENKRNSEFEKKAISFHRELLLRKSLRLWIEERDRRFREKKKWEDAIVYYRKKLLNKTWNAVIKYCSVKIDKVNKIAEVREFYESKLLRRSFRTLRSNVSLAIAERTLYETAIHFDRIILLRKILLAWSNFHRRGVELEKTLEMHIKKTENTLKRKSLKQWGLYVWEKKCNRRRDNIATNHYKKKIAATAIAVMKKYVVYRKEKAASQFYLKTNIARISLALQRIYVDKWRIAVIRFAQTRQKIRRAEDHWSARTTRRYFFVWKIFSERYKVRANLKIKLRDIGKCVLLTKYLKHWRAKYAAVSEVNEKTIHAVTIYSMKIKSRLFNSWKKYANEKIRKKMETNEAMKFHAHLLLRDKLTETVKNRLKRSNNTKKISVEDFRIMRIYFNKWSEFIRYNENRRFQDIARRNTDERAKVIPFSTRLVLPAYMGPKTMTSRDYCEFYESNGQKNNFDFGEFARRYSLFEINRSESADSSTSGSETSNYSSSAT